MGGMFATPTTKAAPCEPGWASRKGAATSADAGVSEGGGGWGLEEAAMVWMVGGPAEVASACGVSLEALAPPRTAAAVARGARWERATSPRWCTTASKVPACCRPWLRGTAPAAKKREFRTGLAALTQAYSRWRLSVRVARELAAWPGGPRPGRRAPASARRPSTGGGGLRRGALNGAGGSGLGGVRSRQAPFPALKARTKRATTGGCWP